MDVKVIKIVMFLILAAIAIIAVMIFMQNTKTGKKVERFLASLFGMSDIYEYQYIYDSNSGIDESDPHNRELILKRIFYKYAHPDIPSWQRWIARQPSIERVKALDQLIKHFNEHEKHWGAITPEAISSLKIFTDLGIEKHLTGLYKKINGMWGEYVLASSYFKELCALLCEYFPRLAVKFFNEEFYSKKSSQSSPDKRKMVIDFLPKIDEPGADILIHILQSEKESPEVRRHAVTKIADFDKNYRLDILKNSIEKMIRQKHFEELPTSQVNKNIFEQVLLKSLQNIDSEFLFPMIKGSCGIDKVHDMVVGGLVKRVENAVHEESDIEPKTLFAITCLPDNYTGDLKKAVSMGKKFSEEEYKSIINTPKAKIQTNIDKLRKSSYETDFWIPEFLDEAYTYFKDKINDIKDLSGSREDYHGCIIMGDNETEKLYFLRAICSAYNWDFHYFDAKKITKKFEFSEAMEILKILNNQSFLYIDNVDNLFESENRIVEEYKRKVLSKINLVALNYSFAYVGSLKMNEVESQMNVEAEDRILELKKLFPHKALIANPSEQYKEDVMKFYLSKISPERIEDENILIDDFISHGVGYNRLEFIDFVTKKLASMMMVFGKTTAVNKVNELENKFKTD